MSSTTSAATPMTFRPPTQWKPNAPKRKQGTKPRRKDFSSVNSNPETGVSFCVPFVKNVGPAYLRRFRNPYVEIEHADASVSVMNLWVRFHSDSLRGLTLSGAEMAISVYIHFAPGRWNDTEETHHSRCNESRKGSSCVYR